MGKSIRLTPLLLAQSPSILLAKPVPKNFCTERALDDPRLTLYGTDTDPFMTMYRPNTGHPSLPMYGTDTGRSKCPLPPLRTVRTLAGPDYVGKN